MEAQQFPFGRVVKPVLPNASGHRQVFVLGVYPSAVHARWRDPDGKVWPALAVDNEPEPFWAGGDARERVASLAREVPPQGGRLEPADQRHNGASGRVLDEFYLRHLGAEGITREDCWITDMVQTYLANRGQLARIRQSYRPLADQGIVPPVNLVPRRGPLTHLTPEREASLREELREASPSLVITLGNEPLRCLDLDPLAYSGYGRFRRGAVLGRMVRILPLVHPRQSGGLGRSSPEWADIHRRWVDERASSIEV